MAKESSYSEDENLLPLVASSELDVDNDDHHEVNFLGIKDKIHTYSKMKLILLSNVLIDAYQHVSNEKDQLMNEYVLLRFNNKDLEVNIENLENTISDL